jgi:primary-amine oxidase
LAEDEIAAPYGTIVAPQINAQYHQHFFTMRVDPMIDGQNNSVVQVDTSALPYPTGHPKNMFGNGFKATYTTLKDTIEGQASANLETSRFWKIVNEGRMHPYAQQPVGWKVGSHHQAPLYAQHDSVVGQRAGFAKKTLWVTPYNEDQMFAGGFYCNQSDGSDTLEQWAKTGDDIVNKDIVLWVTFGITHLPRVEDFPVMPVEMCGFFMKPCNFFIANPGLDIAPTNKKINQSVYAKDFEKKEDCCSKTKL